MKDFDIDLMEMKLKLYLESKDHDTYLAFFLFLLWVAMVYVWIKTDEDYPRFILPVYAILFSLKVVDIIRGSKKIETCKAVLKALKERKDNE